MAVLHIQAGADISAPCRTYRSELHMAALIGLPSTVQHLLDRGGDPNVCDRSGIKLLQGAAAIAFAAAVVRLLLRGGVDVNARNHQGRTALHYATQYGGVDTVDALLHSRALLTPLIGAEKHIYLWPCDTADQHPVHALWSVTGLSLPIWIKKHVRRL